MLTRNQSNSTEQACGFSLIELLITVALIAFLAFVTVPFTVHWVNEQDTKATLAIFEHSYSRAKEQAIKDPVFNGNAFAPSTALCIKEGVIEVRGANGTPGSNTRNGAHCSSPHNNKVLWQEQLAKKIDVRFTNFNGNPETLSCICFGPRGVINNDGDCASCLSQLNADVTFSKGDSHAQTTLF